MNVDSTIRWERLQVVLDNYGEYLCEQLRRNMKANNSNATNTLSNSFTYRAVIEDTPNGTRYYVEVEMEDYWKYVNDGRPPGKMPPVEKIEDWIRVKGLKPEKMTQAKAVESLSYAIQKSMMDKRGYAPPRQALVGWIEKKGITPDLTPSVRSLAWAIAIKIGKYGTKGTKFFDDAVDDAYRKYGEKINEAIQEDINEWVENVMADNIDF